jgi:hypothetical protein
MLILHFTIDNVLRIWCKASLDGSRQFGEKDDGSYQAPAPHKHKRQKAPLSEFETALQAALPQHCN